MTTRDFEKRIREKHEIKYGGIAMAAFLIMMSVNPAFAVLNNPDPFSGCGDQYWGIKTGPTDSYSYGRFNNSQNCNSVPPGLGIIQTGDSRTNYIELTTQSTGPVNWIAAIQGTDPFGNSGNGHQPVTHTNYAISGDDSSLSLTTQFVWLKDSTTNKPIDSKAYANVLTDLWLSPKTQTGYALVIDFASANLYNDPNNLGNWKLHSETFRGAYASPEVTWESNSVCTYHWSIAIDNNSAPNTWRAIPSYTSVSSDIANAAASSSYLNHSGGHCSTSLPSTLNTNSAWKIVDIESGVEIGTTTSPPPSNVGTETGAFSETYLGY